MFDLDGTLWDTMPACAVSWNNCIKKLGLDFREITDDDVRRVTGKSHHDCIEITFSGLTQDKIDALIEMTAAEDMATIERLGGEIYPGVKRGLAKLAERYRLFIVSNCQSGYIETFFKCSGLGKYFQDFECFGNTVQPKGKNLAKLIERNDLQSPAMVGDAIGDEVAARECEIPYFFVTYGFGESENPELSFDSFRELTDFFTI